MSYSQGKEKKIIKKKEPSAFKGGNLFNAAVLNISVSAGADFVRICCSSSISSTEGGRSAAE